MSDSATAVAHARTALAGNPSDGYGGAVLAMTLERFGAVARATVGGDGNVTPPSELVSATIARFARQLEPAAAATAVHWRTSIPRAVGLGGSSAIVIATLRALCDLYGVTLDAVQLAYFALAVETEELGIAAGPQDRVAQSFGRLTFMDFSDPPTYEHLDPELLPPLAIAWLPDTAAASSEVHGELRVRGDEIRPAMAELADAARHAREALQNADHAAFATAVDRTFDLRATIMELDPRHVALIDRARRAGAAANYTGSGGAVVAVCSDESHRDAVSEALAREGSHRITV